MTLLEKIVLPLCDIQYHTLPDEVIEKTKLCIIHSLACAYAGLEDRWSRAAREMTKDMSPSGGATVWFSAQKSNMAEAAFVNGVYAQSILYEDIHRDSNAHPGVIIVPAVFAVAEETGASMEDVLAAVVAGYETMARIGRGTACLEFGKRGFRPTSIIGTFGSCVAAGRLLRLSQPQMLTAFALAASFTCGVNQWAIEGTDDLYFQNGIAARNGIIAAQLAKRGITAPEKIIEGSAGICAAFGFSQTNLEALPDKIEHYAIMDVLFKPAPACALVQTTAQAGVEAARQGIRPEEVLKATIYTFQLGKTYAGCDYAGPFHTLLQARMSNQFNFAAAMVHKNIANQNYCDFENPEVSALAHNISVVEDKNYTKEFPQKQPVRVELQLCNGEVRTIYKEEPIYLKREDIISKLFDHCEPSLGRERVAQIVKTAFCLEQLNSPSQFLALFQ